MTYKQLPDVSQVQNMAEVVPENYLPNGNDIIFNQDKTMYQNIEPVINQVVSTFIPNTVTQWNYQMNAVQPPQTTDEELQRKISTVSTVSNLSSLSSDSVQGLVLQDIQHHAIIHEENSLQNNQTIYAPNQEVININQSDNLNYCNSQSPSNDAYLSNVQPYNQETQIYQNYNNQVNFPEETCQVEEKCLNNVEPSINTAESDKQNLR